MFQRGQMPGIECGMKQTPFHLIAKFQISCLFLEGRLETPIANFIAQISARFAIARIVANFRD